METKKEYEEKLLKLQQKATANLQRLISTAFEVVAEAQDINERLKEVQELLQAEPAPKK